MDNPSQQLTYPLDYVSRSIVEEIVKSLFKTSAVLPQMTTTERGSFFPPKGTVIYNTTTNKLNFYTGSAWEAVTSA